MGVACDAKSLGLGRGGCVAADVAAIRVGERVIAGQRWLLIVHGGGNSFVEL